MTDTSALSPIERARLSAQLLGVRQKLAGGTLSPMEKMRASALGLELRTKLGEKAPVPAPTPDSKPLVMGTLAQKNGGLLVMGDPEALEAYARAYMDQGKYTKAPTGLLLTKSQTRMAQYFPSSQQTLPSGAVVYSYAALNGVSVAVDGKLSGIARNLAELKSLMAQEWGADKYRAVFGEDAAPADVQAYQDEQAAIAQRKTDTAARENAERLAYAERTGDKSVLTDEEKAAIKAENDAFTAQWEAQTQADWEATIGQGKVDNPRYQAYLDTLEDIHAIGRTMVQVGYMGWVQSRLAEYRATGAEPMPYATGPGRDAWNAKATAYIRQWADQHLSDRVKQQRAGEPVPSTAETVDNAEGQAAFDKAKAFYQENLKGRVIQSVVGPVQINGASWKKMKFGMKADVLKARLVEFVVEILQTGKAGGRRESYKDRSDQYVAFYFIEKVVRVDDLMVTAGVTVAEDAKGNLFYNVSHEGNAGWGTNKNGVSDYAWIKPRSDDAVDGILDAAGPTLSDDNLNITIISVAPASEQEAPPAGEPAPAAEPQIIEYTTKRDKILRGIIRTDLTLEEAKAIDPYTWRMNGGYFIREKHLGVVTTHIQASTVPVVLSPEQIAEKQERDARQAQERQQQALASQVSKLRETAAKALDNGNEGMNADRKTNTSRRAGMAASAYARAANDEAEGRTLNSIADALEVGAAGPLAALSSRAQLQELKRALARAKYDVEAGLTYAERSALSGQPATPEAIQHVRMPSRMVWSNRYRNAAMTIAKKAPAGNSKLIAALTKMSSRTERWELTRDADIAITRKAYAVLGTIKDQWDLKDVMEMMAKTDRLKRMGITNDAQLQDACRALLPHLAATKEESAVVKAERAIIGQKVGIDFFPTPAHVAQRMAKLARITKGMRVLEPSAGNGNLADAAAAAGGVVDVIEISSQLRDILTAKGYNVVDHDFNGFTPETPYPAILMNPPFSNRQDAEHIMRAYGMLASGGTLVAIAGEGVFFGQDKKAEAFRDWLETHTADVQKLDGGTFQDNALLAQTSANARLIVLHK